MNRKTYTTERLVLKPYSSRHFTEWERFIDSARARRNKYDWQPAQGFRPTRTEFRKILAKHARGAREDRIYVWPIFRLKEQDLVGFVDLYVIQRKVLQFANLGYRIDNRFWGMGLGTEALMRMIPAVLKDLRLNRLEAVIDIDNRRSTALARAVGMRREGIRRRYYYQDRHWADQVVYVIDRADVGLPVLHP